MMTHNDIKHLTAPERLTFIADVWDSLSEEETPLSMPQFQELQRRIVSFESDRAHAMNWEQLKAKLIERAP